MNPRLNPIRILVAGLHSNQKHGLLYNQRYNLQISPSGNVWFWIFSYAYVYTGSHDWIRWFPFYQYPTGRHPISHHDSHPMQPLSQPSSKPSKQPIREFDKRWSIDTKVVLNYILRMHILPFFIVYTKNKCMCSIYRLATLKAVVQVYQPPLL